MNTAEVAIEHVLTGLLALCAFLLPLLSGLTLDEKLLRSETLVVVLGAAYLFGVVFDRLADTILSPIEQWLRLKLADRLHTKTRLEYKGDPFPQDVLEFSLRSEQGGRVAWMDSLRGRIRTSRGFAVFGLPAAMGIAIFLYAEPVSQVRWDWWPHSLVALNLFFMFMAAEISSLRPLDKKAGDEGGTEPQPWLPKPLWPGSTAELLRGEALLKKSLESITDADLRRCGQTLLKKPLESATAEDLREYRRSELKAALKSVKDADLLDYRETLLKRSRNRMYICCIPYILMLITSGVTLACIVVWPHQFWAWPVIGLAFIVVNALPLRVWWRITETHMSFIYRKLPEFLEEKAGLVSRSSLESAFLMVAQQRPVSSQSETGAADPAKGNEESLDD